MIYKKSDILFRHLHKKAKKAEILIEKGFQLSYFYPVYFLLKIVVAIPLTKNLLFRISDFFIFRFILP